MSALFLCVKTWSAEMILLSTKRHYFGFFDSLKTTKAVALIPIVNLISAAVYFIDFFNMLIILYLPAYC